MLDADMFPCEIDDKYDRNDCSEWQTYMLYGGDFSHNFVCKHCRMLYWYSKRKEKTLERLSKEPMIG